VLLIIRKTEQGETLVRNTVFIHTNDRQMLGAIVSRHSLKRFSADPDRFDVRILRREDFPFFEEFEGRKFLRAGGWRPWRNDDLQSFTPVRFSPPEVMGYQGKAIVVDPDVFAVGDVNELFDRDMQGKAIMAKPRGGHNNRNDYIATSVMLLDNAKLTHWNMRENFEKMFRGELDYEDWIVLATEPRETIGFLEPCWNDFDRLTRETRLLHNTKRRTQPWKTGLPIDFTNRVPLISRLLPGIGFRVPGRYKRHPDPRQEGLFFALLRECLESGQATEHQIRHEMATDHVRHDALEVLKRTPAVDDILNQTPAAA
jgi:hypothetical protein